MQKIYHSWLGMAALTLMLFSNLALAIDNPDAPDLISQFETREKPFIAAIEKPSNTSSDYSAAYSNYLKFLDKELNTVYKTLRTKLPEDKQKQLKASQVSWLKYRDLEFSFIDGTWTNKDFGTSSGISRGQYKASIVRNRVIQLMHYARAF
jgi:uncharacterized protein YecT (DUF1311 family)